MRKFVGKAHRAAIERYLYGYIPLTGFVIAMIQGERVLAGLLLALSVLVDIITYLYKESNLWEAPRMNRTN